MVAVIFILIERQSIILKGPLTFSVEWQDQVKLTVEILQPVKEANETF